MSALNIKPAGSCKYDMIALGEIMLRLDPGEGRVRCAREFKVWEGGGEYNVARGLRRCFGLKTAVATAFADNDVGRLIEDFILQGGVDTEFIKWAPFDGVGRDRKSTRLNSSHVKISYAVFCLKKKINDIVIALLVEYTVSNVLGE